MANTEIIPAKTDLFVTEQSLKIKSQLVLSLEQLTVVFLCWSVHIHVRHCHVSAAVNFSSQDIHSVYEESIWHPLSERNGPALTTFAARWADISHTQGVLCWYTSTALKIRCHQNLTTSGLHHNTYSYGSYSSFSVSMWTDRHKQAQHKKIQIQCRFPVILCN